MKKIVLLLLLPTIGFAQNDCVMVNRGVNMISSYFTCFAIQNDSFILKPSCTFEKIHDDNMLAQIKSIDYPNLILESKKSCHKYALVRSFSNTYKKALKDILPTLMDSIKLNYQKDELDKAFDFSTIYLRLVVFAEKLTPDDVELKQKNQNIRALRDEIDKLIKVKTEATIMKINQTISRPATLADAIESLIYRLREL